MEKQLFANCGINCAACPADQVTKEGGDLDAIQTAIDLVKSSKVAFLGSNGADGYPNIKAMLELATNGLETMYFSSNTSSRRVADLRANPKACLYYVDTDHFIGLMLVGEIEIVSEQATKDRLWRTGFERYYPLGKTDPDYSILKFTAKWGKLYNDGKYVKCFHIQA